MDSTTLLCRTPAGDSELAVPANGLSITQRRILTLLDSPVRLCDLAIGQTLDAERIHREASRLVHAGLAAIASPPVEANGEPAAAVVRLGTPRLARKGLMALLATAAVALVWVAWQYAARPAPAGAIRLSARPVVTPAIDVPVASEPAVIATRVLRSEPPDRSRDAARQSHPPPARTAVVPLAADPVHSVVNAAKASPTTPDAATVHAKQPKASVNVETPAATSPVASTTVSASPPNAPTARAPSEASAATNAPPAAAAPVLTDKPAAAASTAPDAAPARAASPAAPAPQSAGPAEAPVQLALAALPAAPVRPAPPSQLVPVSREAPTFPREAIAQGIERGSVKARLTIDAQGHVSSVEILDAMPRRVFDRAVRHALGRWQFEPGAGGRTTTVDVVFKRD